MIYTLECWFQSYLQIWPINQSIIQNLLLMNYFQVFVLRLLFSLLRLLYLEISIVQRLEISILGIRDETSYCPFSASVLFSTPQLQFNTLWVGGLILPPPLLPPPLLYRSELSIGASDQMAPVI